MSAMSPKTNKRLGYSNAGVTAVDKQMLNAKTSLQSLLQRSQLPLQRFQFLRVPLRQNVYDIFCLSHYLPLQFLLLPFHKSSL